jgi:high-affinity Fe2+/Pb2+ permease
MEKQIVYEISETTQQVINGLMRQIADLEQIISNLETDVIAVMNLRENDHVQAAKTIENQQQKIDSLTATLIRHYEVAQ